MPTIDRSCQRQQRTALVWLSGLSFPLNVASNRSDSPSSIAVRGIDMPFVHLGTGWFIGIAVASALHVIQQILPELN